MELDFVLRRYWGVTPALEPILEAARYLKKIDPEKATKLYGIVLVNVDDFASNTGCKAELLTEPGLIEKTINYYET